MDIVVVEKVTEAIKTMWPILDERGRRLYAATQANILGHGGISIVSKICGLSRVTITNGIKEISDMPDLEEGRIRKAGGGRQTIKSKDLTLEHDLLDLLEGSTRGDPEKLLFWTLKSTRNLAKALNSMGHQVSYVHVSSMQKDLGYSLQSNRKLEEGT
jgi:hypothetical protein